MSVLLSSLARSASPRVVAVCIVAIVFVYLALTMVLVTAAITALVTTDDRRRSGALALVRLLRWRG